MNSGIIRRIDDLGRIVIPKEIRRVLHVKEGDPFEISLSGKGIKLERYSPLTCLKEQSDTFIKVLTKELNVAAVICDLDAVISGRGTNLSGGTCVSSGAQSLIRNQKDYQYDENSTLHLTDSDGCLINGLYPIGTMAAPCGALVLLRNQDVNITPLQDKTAKMIALVLSELTKE